MNIDEVKFILSHSSQHDWVINDEIGAFTYKQDVLLRIQRQEFDEYNSFNEPWAVKHPDHQAYSVKYTVYYGSSFIEERTLVSVDGHRATLPMPESRTDLTVTASDVNFAKIVDILGKVDEYIRRSGISIRH